MAALRPLDPIQLRFKRVGRHLSEAKCDVTLDAQVDEKLEGVLQSYGLWEHSELERPNLGSPKSSAPGAASPGNAHAAASHWKGLNFLAVGKVVYLNPRQTPREARIKSGQLIRVTEKRRTPLAEISTQAPCQETARSSTNPGTDTELQSHAPGRAQVPTPAACQAPASSSSPCSSVGAVPELGTVRQPEAASISQLAGSLTELCLSQTEEQQQEREGRKEGGGIPCLGGALPESGEEVQFLPKNQQGLLQQETPGQQGARESTVHAEEKEIREEQGIAGQGPRVEDQECGLDQLDLLAKALEHKWKGDMAMVGDRLLGAIKEYTKGLGVLDRQPSAEEASTDMQTLWLDGRLQLMSSRVVALNCLQERANDAEKNQLKEEVARRILRDANHMMLLEPSWGAPYTYAAGALLGLGLEQASVSILKLGKQRCDEPGKLQCWLTTHFEGVPASRRNLEQAQEEQRQWEAETQASGDTDARWVARLKADPVWTAVIDEWEDATMAMIQDHVADPEGTSEWPALVYQTRPYTGYLASWDDPALQHIEADQARQLQISAFRETALLEFPGGLYGEFLRQRARERSQKGTRKKKGKGRRRDRGQALGEGATAGGGSGGSIAADGLSAITPMHQRNLELAKRCNAFGNTAARKGRIINAGLWYCRGAFLLAPDGRASIEDAPPGTKPLGLALIHNRSCMAQALLKEPSRSGQVPGTHRFVTRMRAVFDAIWCAYYSHGCIPATLRLFGALVLLDSGDKKVNGEPLCFVGPADALGYLEAELEVMHYGRGWTRKEEAEWGGSCTELLREVQDLKGQLDPGEPRRRPGREVLCLRPLVLKFLHALGTSPKFGDCAPDFGVFLCHEFFNGNNLRTLAVVDRARKQRSSMALVA